MNRCKKCGGIIWNDVSICNCKKFLITDEEGDEYQIYAVDEEDAAIEYAENLRNPGYFMDNEVEILIDGKLFTINAEADIQYNISKQ